MENILATVALAESDAWAIGGACILMCMDILIGLAGAVINKDFQSTVMRVGLGHKLMEVCAIALAIVLQVLAEHITEIPSFPSTMFVCAYLIVMEVGSIWENIVKVNPELGSGAINDAIDQIVNGGDKDES